MSWSPEGQYSRLSNGKWKVRSSPLMKSIQPITPLDVLKGNGVKIKLDYMFQDSANKNASKPYLGSTNATHWLKTARICRKYDSTLR